MALSNDMIRMYTNRLLLSRMRILINHGFYGLLLMHMKYGIDEKTPTAYTDGKRIVFGTDFLNQLSDDELDFVMMHEILHVVLQHCIRGKEFESSRFNIACDIVVNSNILHENKMQAASITLKNYGESMHLTPKGDEGYDYTAEEVYQMLPNKNIPSMVLWDDHAQWGEGEDDTILEELWVKRFEDACETIQIREGSNSRGTLPKFAQRMLEELKKSQIDWRIILNEFVQEEVVDYSFSPPDRRFDESPFFLPDFNGKEDMVEDILFMIDTSGSMSDEMITVAYSEVKGAIDQFDGKLKGWLGFFDAVVVEPIPFESIEEFLVIRPAGGGGTSFHIIFEYVRRHMQDKPPASIIVLTDGYAPFPKESNAMGIPVLWLLNNDEVEPPWGKIARIEI